MLCRLRLQAAGGTTQAEPNGEHTAERVAELALHKCWNSEEAWVTCSAAGHVAHATLEAEQNKAEV